MDIGKLFRDAWGLGAKEFVKLLVGGLILLAVTSGLIVLLALIVGGLGGAFNGGRSDVPPGVAIAMVLVFAVVAIAVGALSYIMTAGLTWGLLERVRRGREMSYGDVFAGFRRLGPLITAAVIIGLVFAALLVVPTVIAILAAASDSTALGVVAAVLYVVVVVAFVYLSTRWVYSPVVIMDRDDVGGVDSLRISGTLVHARGWWWTFLALVVIQLVIGLVNSVLAGFGAFLTMPFLIAYMVAMYFQATDEGGLIDAVLLPAGQPTQQTWAAQPPQQGWGAQQAQQPWSQPAQPWSAPPQPPQQWAAQPGQQPAAVGAPAGSAPAPGAPAPWQQPPAVPLPMQQPPSSPAGGEQAATAGERSAEGSGAASQPPVLPETRSSSGAEPPAPPSAPLPPAPPGG